MTIDKRELVATLRASLQEEIDAMTRIARDAAQAATHEENKPEGDKDMRSTEASYVARGQAGRVLDLEHAHAVLGSMELRDFGPDDAIAASAIVELRQGARKNVYFVVTAAGGRKVKVGNVEVQTLLTTSPLGEALLGLSAGDDVEIASPQGRREYQILSVR